MPEPLLTEVYGSGATQTASQLVIQKADMVSRGLTTATANTAESMLVYLILQTAATLTEANRLTDLLLRNVTVTYSGQDLIDQGAGNVYLRDTYQVSLYKVTAIQPIDPDNY